MIKINYKSDFKINESSETVAMEVPFVFSYYVFDSKKYVVSFDGHNYVNCERKEDGSLDVIFNQPEFGIGHLKVERKYAVDDKAFADGVFDVVTVDKTDVFITSGQTFETYVKTLVVPPYLKGDKGDPMTWETMTEKERGELVKNIAEAIDPEMVMTENEKSRQEAEQSRQTAEQQRSTTFNTLKGEMQSAITAGNAAAGNAQKVVDNYDAKVAEQDGKLSELGSEIGHTNSIGYDGTSATPYRLNKTISKGETLYIWVKLLECEGNVYILSYDSKTYTTFIVTNPSNIGAWKMYEVNNTSDNEITSLVVSSASSVFNALIVEGKNPITVETDILKEQSLIQESGYSITYTDKSSLKEQIEGNENTSFKILYDYDLKGETINIPNNSKLVFKGGIIRNGTLNGNIDIVADRYKIFDNITFSSESNIVTADLYTEWWGCKCDGVTDDSDYIQKAIDTFMSINVDNYAKSYNLKGGNHYISKPISIKGTTKNYAYSHQVITIDSIKADFEGYAVTLDGDINGFEIYIGCLTNTGGCLTCGKDAGVGVLRLNGNFWRSTDSNVLNLDASEGNAIYINDIEVSVKRFGYGSVVIRNSNNNVFYHNTFEYGNVIVDSCFNTTFVCPHTSDKGRGEFIVETLGYCPSTTVIGGSSNTAWVDRDYSILVETSTKWKFSEGTNGVVISNAASSGTADCYHSIINGRVLSPLQKNKSEFSVDTSNNSLYVDTSLLNGKSCPTIFDCYEGLVNKVYLDSKVYGGKGKVNDILFHATSYGSILIDGVYMITYPANTDKWVRLVWDGEWFEQPIERMSMKYTEYTFVKGSPSVEILLDKEYSQNEIIKLRLKMESSEGNMYITAVTKSNNYIHFATLDVVGSWKSFLLKNENESPITKLVFSSASASGTVFVRY